MAPSELSLDLCVLAIVGFVVVCSAAGAAIDGFKELSGRKRSGTPLWVLGMLISSYCLLIPGLVLDLFSSSVEFNLLGHEMPVSSSRENMFELIRRMFESGLYVGAAFVTTYAVLIPIAKIVLLIFGCVWQYDPAKVGRARWCIRFVQLVSKWASPDMFAYILMAFLFRSLNNPPHLLSDMRLKLGFTCFCVFCLGSTISSLGIQVPELPEDAGAATPPQKQPRCGLRCRGVFIALLSIAFAGLMLVGLALPCMDLRLDMELLYQHKPKLAALRSILDGLGLADLMHQEVSIWGCVIGLAKWAFHGDLNSGLALVMYAVFAVALPILDVGALLFAACASRPEARGRALRASRVLKKLSMLDVSIMGNFIVVLSLQSMRSKGVVIDVCAGAFFLLGAEICHYALARVVQNAYAADGAARQASAKGCAAVEKTSGENKDQDTDRETEVSDASMV